MNRGLPELDLARGRDFHENARTTTIHPGVFRGRALWGDSVSPRMNTIASRDQFKPIRIRKNLVVNYNAL